MDNIEKEKSKLLELRKKIFIASYKGGMAHLASCYSALEMIYALYMRGILRYNPDNPKWNDRDRFILSKGHAGLALYSVLLEAGLIKESVFNSYLQTDSEIGGEPCMRDCEWVEATTGSLGHGLSMGLGIAMALKMNKSNAKVYVMLGDGECQEGVVWEAVMTAPSFEANNLVVILDCNGIQKMDSVENIIGKADWKAKWESFGWEVLETDGHDIDSFVTTLATPGSNKPRLIISHTVKGKGVSIMENNPNWHFKLPNRKELIVFKAELGIADSELEQK